MLSYPHGACAQELLGETIGENLERTIARVPGTEALVSCWQGQRYTYAELGEAVDRLASGMLAAGLERGDLVGVWSPNRAEWMLAQYATAKLGVILVNVNPAYRISELQFALGKSGCRWLFAAPECKGADFMAMSESAAAQLPALERRIFFGTDEWDELAAARADRDTVAAHMAELDFDDPINIQYTSGTTGFPKGATLTHHNILNNGFFVPTCCAIRRPTASVSRCRSTTASGWSWATSGRPATARRSSHPAETFDPAATLAACAQERCTSLYGVPTMFIAQLEHPDFSGHDLGSLRTGIMAGSPCPIEIMRRVSAEMGIGEMAIAFGMTETSPVTTQVRIDDTLENRCSTVGQVMPHTEIKIVDPATGRIQPRGERGEFMARGYMVMQGYWDDPERTAEAIDAGRWMHTGDLATMDEHGYVRVVGRIKDMIIRGGENIYPREIEEFLDRHPAVADVQVIGVPDERYGEELMAWIVVREGQSLDEETMREFCRGQIAHYKIPRYMKVVDGFPMTVTGKVQKFKMRKEAIAELGLDRAAAVATA
jgi:fatty-acyl-CoA synthase